MRGEDVIVRAFGGSPLARKVWGVGERVIYITDEEGLNRLISGRKAPPPIGFPKEDVFHLDEKLYRRLESAYTRKDMRNLKGIWSEAKPYLEE